MAQRDAHDKLMAKVVSEAATATSEAATDSDRRMTRAGLEAGVMKLAYDKLSIEIYEQHRTSAQVSTAKGGSM